MSFLLWVVTPVVVTFVGLPLSLGFIAINDVEQGQPNSYESKDE